MSRFTEFWRNSFTSEAKKAPAPAPVAVPGANATPRAGFEYGMPKAGLTAQTVRASGGGTTDRQTLMTDLYDAFLACNWSFTAVTAIARTITAGGIGFRWDNEDGEGDQEAPPKPVQVQQCERLLKFTNPREDIIQLLRSTVADLLVFGDAYIEVVWSGTGVGRIPVALYTLDCPSTSPISDSHGNVSGYLQVTEQGQEAHFEPTDIIHISLDAPRSGIFGVSPTYAALLPIKIWLFTAATLKETMRKGLPPNLHVDHPSKMSDIEQDKWVDQYMSRNVGPMNLGRPVMTKGGGTVTELQHSALDQLLHVLDQQRDAVLATYGCPPAEAGVIESGNLGGGTGEAQHKMFEVNTCAPIAALILEKLNYLLIRAFGIDGWSLGFDSIDMRDSEIIEKIRDMRLRNGSWILDRYRSEIGEPPVEGGDQAVLVDRGNVIAWRDMEVFSTSTIAKALINTALQPDAPVKGQPVTLTKIPDPVVPLQPMPIPGQPPPVDPLHPDNAAPTADGTEKPPGQPPAAAGKESSYARTPRPQRETWRLYSARVREAMRELPDDRTAVRPAEHDRAA